MRTRSCAGLPIIGGMAAAVFTVAVVLPAQATTEAAPPAAPASAADAPPSSSTAETSQVPVSSPPASSPSPSEAPVGTKTAGTPEAAEPAKPKPLPTTLVARINLTTQTMTVQAHGKTIHSWKVSTGAPGYATPPGTFRPGWMAKDWRSRQYDDAPMPYSVFFNGGIAVHGTMNPGSLGRAASHGCVRVATPNAATFFRLVQRHGMAQTRIVVHGAQPFGRNEAHAARAPGRAIRSSTEWVYATGTPAARQTSVRRSTDVYGYRPAQQPRRQAAVRAPSSAWSW